MFLFTVQKHVKRDIILYTTCKYTQLYIYTENSEKSIISYYYPLLRH